MSNEVPARPASTILLLRDRADGFDVFMMVRHYQIEFASGALVFPGGSVDAGDRDIIGRPELYASAVPGEGPSLDFQIAAIRETFEESGILLARPQGGADLIAPAQAAAIAEAHRTALCEHTVAFADILAEHRLALALDLLQ